LQPATRWCRFEANRVASLRTHRRIPCFEPKSDSGVGEVMTIAAAATELNVAPSTLHRWLNEGLIAGEQVTPGAPWRIRRLHAPSRVGASGRLDVELRVQDGGAFELARQALKCACTGGVCIDTSFSTRRRAVLALRQLPRSNTPRPREILLSDANEGSSNQSWIPQMAPSRRLRAFAND
jgi:hypothetical protein